MKTIISILFILFSLGILAQTTVRFSQTHQSFDPLERVLSVSIQVDDIHAYDPVKPIILKLFSNLENPQLLGITTSQGIDKVIWPEQYSDGEEIQLPVNTEALKSVETFELVLRKKDGNGDFQIAQPRHVVVVNKSVIEKAYVGIQSASGKKQKIDFTDEGRIEVPFSLHIKGYVPVEADEAFANITIKGIGEIDGTNAIVPLTGSQITDKIVVEKSKTPEAYEKIVEMLDSGEQPELGISSLVHNSSHQIMEDPLNKTMGFTINKAPWTDTSYSFYVGPNFDFSNNFEARDIYYEVDISLLNLFKSRWGLRAGMYKNNVSRYLEDFMLRPTHYELVDETITGSKVYNLIQTGMAPRIFTESLGFYFDIPYKIVESDNFNVFISPHFEIIERRETYTYEVVYENVLSTEITIYNLDFSTPRPLPNQVFSKYWEGYLGLSFPMLYRNHDEDFQVTINPIVGAGYPGSYAVFENTIYRGRDFDYIQIVEDNSGPRFFSAFQFNLIINPKESLGIKLGADVRKYFGGERKPIVSVNLSTKLDFAKIFNLTKG